MSEVEIRVAWTPAESPSRAIVDITLPDERITEELAVLDRRERAAFITDLCGERPGVPRYDLERELQRIASEVGDRAGLGGNSAEEGAEEGVLRTTDSANVDRLVALHGDDIRYIEEWGRFLAWDGTRWKHDHRSVRVKEKTADVPDVIRQEAARLSRGKSRDRLYKWANSSENASKRKDIVGLLPAYGRIRSSHEQVDRKPGLLNLRNGTLDFSSLELREHRRGDLLTQRCPVEWCPEAKHETWTRFLEQVLPEVGIRAFVQRAVGYTLTGSVDEQVLFALIGRGQNGKSTFMHVLQRLLGNYSAVVPPKVLLQGGADTHPTTLASLFGKRLAVSNDEAVAGSYWDPSRVKQLTGGDRLTARRMREDFWEFDPTHKLWILANDLPQAAPARGGDSFALMRRLIVVDFPVVISEAEKDPELPRKLTRELPGILRWAVDGLREWRGEGLSIPESCRTVGPRDRAYLDPVGDFLQSCTTESPDSSVPARELYEAYKVHAGRRGVAPISQTGFGAGVGKRLARREAKTGRIYLGIALEEVVR